MLSISFWILIHVQRLIYIFAINIYLTVFKQVKAYLNSKVFCLNH